MSFSGKQRVLGYPANDGWRSLTLTHIDASWPIQLKLEGSYKFSCCVKLFQLTCLQFYEYKITFSYLERFGIASQRQFKDFIL